MTPPPPPSSTQLSTEEDPQEDDRPMAGYWVRLKRQGQHSDSH